MNASIKYCKIALVACFIVFAVILAKYKVIYKVTIDGVEVGRIKSKAVFEQYIEEHLDQDASMAFYDYKSNMKYEILFVDNVVETNEAEVFAKVKDELQVTYVVYAITLNGETVAHTNTMEDAKTLIDELTTEVEVNGLEADVGVYKEYTDSLEVLDKGKLEVAQVEADTEIKKEIKVKESTVNGVALAFTPTKGSLSSRYGSRWGTMHSGIDIAAPIGTDIYACAGGTVTKAEYYGGYGNFIIIDHGNGVQTCYGHCSAIYVKSGETVEAGHLIGAVGSTGRSTGPHLHLEVRIDGKAVNPQQYLYK